MTPWLWESPIYINILMHLAILPEVLGLFSLFLAKPSNSGKIAKFMKIFIQIGDVETEYREMLFRLETERSNKELYWIIAQSKPV